MNGVQQRLIVAGLGLILAGFLFGLFFSWSVGHQPRLFAHDAYLPVFEEIARTGDSGEWQQRQAEITDNSVRHRRAADVHGHGTNMGLLLVLVGLLAPLLKSGAANGPRVLYLLGLSAVVYPAGLALQYLTLTTAGEAVAALGAAGAIGSLAVIYLRIRKAVDNLDP